MAPITLRNIVKHYGNLAVIEDLSLAIEDREFIVLVGPSGCGKSTLLRILAGLEEVTSGDILIGDDRVNGLPASKRDIAMVFQDYALYPHMTVRQNMAFALEMRGLSKSDIDERVRRAAELLAIGEFLDRRPKALSGGQRQRVAMGRAIVRDPRVFLFDEPLSNLDAKLRAQVRAEIKALSQQIQTTMVFVTHDQVEAMTMADRIVVMKSGVIQQIGTPEEVYERPANQFVAGFIGSPAMNFMPAELTDGRLRVGEDTAFAAADLYSTEPHPLSDAPLQFGIRPEHFVVAPDEKEAIRAEVQLVEPLGSDTYIHFRFAGYNTIARVAPDLRPKPGDVVPLMPARDKAHLFDGRSGQAIR